jgi:hydroxymethylpyrimidine/phosphomethylpyrimidine kinase
MKTGRFGLLFEQEMNFLTSSAGVGIQADLKTFQHFQVLGLTSITCVVSETQLIVLKVHPVPVDVLADQVGLLLETYPVGAIISGMRFRSGNRCNGPASTKV